jgi:simple sugar transport system permease protein
MEAFVASAIVFALPLLIAAVAGTIAERTGVLNVGLEGFMLGGAFTAAWVAASAESQLVGLAAVLALGVAAGLLYGFLVVLLRADQIAVGIAFNIFMLGATTYGFFLVNEGGDQRALVAPRGGTVEVPALASWPWVGPIFQQHWLTYVALGLALAAFAVIFRTGLGIRARACGEYSDGARAAGLNVARWRMLATALSCGIAALAGAYLVLALASQFVPNMTAGRGYIALAVIILARWNPVAVVPAALLFGGAQALDLQTQNESILDIKLPAALVQTIPYVVTIVAVAIVGRKVVPPAEDGRPLPVR